MEIGTRVRPVDGFDFGQFFGPDDLNSRGVVEEENE